MTDLIARPRRLRKSPALRAMFEETTLTLNDLVLPIFVEEEIDDYKAIEAMPGVMRIPEKHLAREIERIANAGIRSVMTFGISHHTDATGSITWKEDGLVARMSRICKETVPEMVVMSDTCFCEYVSRPLRRAVRSRRGQRCHPAESWQTGGRRCRCRCGLHRPICGNGRTGSGNSSGAGRGGLYRYRHHVLLH